jgi:hypothetical protein
MCWCNVIKLRPDSDVIFLLGWQRFVMGDVDMTGGLGMEIWFWEWAGF